MLEKIMDLQILFCIMAASGASGASGVDGRLALASCLFIDHLSEKNTGVCTERRLWFDP